jgi:hypothetical protein
LKKELRKSDIESKFSGISIIVNNGPEMAATLSNKRRGKQVSIKKEMISGDIQEFNLVTNKVNKGVSSNSKVAPRGNSQNLAKGPRKPKNLIISSKAGNYLGAVYKDKFKARFKGLKKEQMMNQLGRSRLEMLPFNKKSKKDVLLQMVGKSPYSTYMIYNNQTMNMDLNATLMKDATDTTRIIHHDGTQLSNN